MRSKNYAGLPAVLSAGNLRAKALGARMRSNPSREMAQGVAQAFQNCLTTFNKVGFPRPGSGQSFQSFSKGNCGHAR